MQNENMLDESKLLTFEKLDFICNTKLMENINKLAVRAFRDRNHEAWKEIQLLLFNINLKIMKNGFGLGSVEAMEDWLLRNIIEREEKKFLPQEKIPESVTNTTETFLFWIKNQIVQHRINHHPLFSLFDNDDLSDEELRYFLANYRVNMQRFHLHVAAYSLFAPFDMRGELYNNLYDEMGQGNFQDAHPNLFEPLMEHFGGSFPEDINIETCHLLNTKISICWFSKGFYYGLGGMGALELSIPYQQRRILAHFRRRKLSDKLVKFFVVHCECDEHHGNEWFNAGMPHVQTKEQYEEVYWGAMRILEARAGVFDGILKGIMSRREKSNVKY